MHLDYWCLKERPFEVVPDANYFYPSPNHEEALQRLLFCCHEHRGASILTGEYGCGKTLLSRVLLRELATDIRCQIALIVNPKLSPREFLATVFFELGGSKEKGPPDKVTLLENIKEILTGNAKAGRETILIIDEAQAIENEEVLEEIRLLMNIQNENELLLTILFIGQPEFKEKIQKIKPLEQRVQMWFHLPPLSAEETKGYIQHRLHIAGVDAEIFTPEACQKVFSLTGGIPRLVNNLCNLSLWIAERERGQKIDSQMVEAAFNTLKGG